MSKLDNLWQMQSEIAALAERLKRELQEIEREKAAKAAGAPTEIEYDRSKFPEAPFVAEPDGYHGEQDESERPPGPKCHCGLRAVFKKSAPQSPKPWAAYFCARAKGDPKNCGFRQWMD